MIARAWPRFQVGHDDVLDPRYLPKAMANARKNRWRSEVRETLKAAGVRGAAVPDPEALMIAEEALSRFEDALARLPVRARETFLAVDIGGASIDEVADASGVSRKAIEMRLARARRKLRAAITDEHEQTRT